MRGLPFPSRQFRTSALVPNNLNETPRKSNLSSATWRTIGQRRMFKTSAAEYDSLVRSANDPETRMQFWATQADKYVSWDKKPKVSRHRCLFFSLSALCVSFVCALWVYIRIACIHIVLRHSQSWLMATVAFSALRAHVGEAHTPFVKAVLLAFQFCVQFDDSGRFMVLPVLCLPAEEICATFLHHIYMQHAQSSARHLFKTRRRK